LYGSSLGGENPPSSYLFGRVVEEAQKGVASYMDGNHLSGWQAHNREVMGEGSCRQNHRPKQKYVNLVAAYNDDLLYA